MSVHCQPKIRLTSAGGTAAASSGAELALDLPGVRKTLKIGKVAKTNPDSVEKGDMYCNRQKTYDDLDKDQNLNCLREFGQKMCLC